MRKKLLSMLVLLMVAVTGAWAQEQSETIATTDYIVEGTHFTISISEDSYADGDGMLADGGITVTSKNGETITKVVITCTCYTDLVNDGTTSVSSGTKEITNGGGTITVTGVNASTFTFTCSDDYPQFGQFVVYYTEAPVAVTGVTLAPTTATLTLGETETVTLIPTVLPDDATDKSVTWSSSNEAVATVSNDGVVTAVAAGTATITVTTTDGAKTATCAVTVAAPAASTYTVTLKEGTEDATNWTIAPAEATTTGVAAGTTVTATYSGLKKVKSVKAVKKAQAWNLTAKLAYTGGEIADFTDATDDLTTMTWAVGEHIAILYEVSGTKKVADAEITAVDGTTGAATIQFTVEEGTPDNTACTLVYPYDAAKDDHTGVKDAATLLAAQDGTLSANLDVRVGEGTIQTTTPGLTVTTQPAAQFAIFKFTTQSKPDQSSSLQNTDVTKLTVTTGGQDYVITPASATSTLYAALPAVSGQTVSFTATDGSNLYAASKAGVSFDAAKYYQSTVKMGKVIEVFKSDDPKIDDFVSPSPSLNYLHIGLDQAYAIAKQLSTQNGDAKVAVVYNHNGPTAKYALSSDASAKENTGMSFILKNYRMFLATLWESAQ